MCGIAGVIHRDGATGVGKEMTAMLLSLRHRGPDSTGFAVYGASTPNEYVMRLKLAEHEDLAKDHRIRQKIRERQAEVDSRLAELGAEIIETSEPTPMPSAIACAFPGIRGGLPPRSSRSRAQKSCPSAARSS
jgi:glutamate synthase domain-containing protein 1